MQDPYPFPYYFYILTNKHKTTLYCGMTNNLHARLLEHAEGSANRKTFTGRYNCSFLIYYEGYNGALDAIRREKEVKKWSRIKKETLINSLNPAWDWLNLNKVFDYHLKTAISNIPGFE